MIWSAFKELAIVAVAGVGAAVAGAVVLSGGEWEIVGAVAMVAAFGLAGPVLVRLLLGGRRSARAVHAAGAALTLAVPVFFLVLWVLNDDGTHLALYTSAVALVSGVAGYAAVMWRAAAHPIRCTTRPGMPG